MAQKASHGVATVLVDRVVPALPMPIPGPEAAYVPSLEDAWDPNFFDASSSGPRPSLRRRGS